MVEEVLVVGRGSRIAHDQTYPTTATCPAPSLGIVVRSGWNVAQHDRVQAADVDAHLQRWRAGQQIRRAVLGLEGVLDLLAAIDRYLSRVLLGVQRLGGRVESTPGITGMPHLRVREDTQDTRTARAKRANRGVWENQRAGVAPAAPVFGSQLQFKAINTDP